MNASVPPLEMRRCPVCGSPRSRLLHSISFEELSEIRLLGGYDVVVCQDCGAGFADRIPPQAILDPYYRDFSKVAYEYRGGKGTAYEDLRFREEAKTIIPHIPDRGSRILEIGCSTGHLLAVLKEEGYDNVQGVDPSPSCAQAAWDLYRIPVQSHTIFNLPGPDHPFDLVMLIGVMEHIRDLDRAIDKLRGLLAPRGRLYLGVPDAAHFDSNRDAPFQEFSQEHLNFFSATSLVNLMQSRGFKLLSGGRFLLEHSHGTWCASLYCVFTAAMPGTASWARDEETERGLRAYIRQSQEAEGRLRQIIESLAASGRPVVVWGTGGHTQRLLAMSALAQVNIAAFVDSHPKYQGQQLRGIPILPPEGVAGRTEPILISSYAAQHEIVQQIREKLRLDNELILLYEMPE
jgi:SAM-dependent methyltransferase